jgi:hypothetical protein
MMLLLLLNLAAAGGGGIVGAGTIADGADTPAAVGTVAVAAAGTLADGAEVEAGIGKVAVAAGGTIADGAETTSGTGTGGGSMSGTGAVNDGADAASGSGSVAVSGSGGSVDGNDQAGGSGAVQGAVDVLTLDEVKEYLGVFSSDKDPSIKQMIPRARLWVEDHTGIAILQRQFTERLLPSSNGVMRLSKGPLVADSVTVSYIDSNGSLASFVPTLYPPIGTLYGGTTGWPMLARNEQFTVTYTAGDTTVDDRLKGAILALIEGEFSEGYAYPERSTEAAARCCTYLRQMVV